MESLGELSGTQTVSRTGTWARGCDSANLATRYARYYGFTVTAQTVMTIDLTSSDTRPYLYLIRGEGTEAIIDHVVIAQSHEEISLVLRPGSYTIQATTFSHRATGNFTLEIDASPLNICVESLGELSGTQTVSRTGTWARGCDSANLATRYARYYGFTVTAQTVMTIDLTSSDTRPYLYLIRGEGTEAIIDHVVIAQSQENISLVLRPGSYTIQATTFIHRATGNFTLEINTWRQNVCIESLGELSGTQTVSRTGTWARGCDSVNRVARYAQYYSFTLTHDAIMTVDLTSPTSGADPYLYLIQGAGADGRIIALNDDGGEGRNSQIVRHLQPGAYTIEATTFSPGFTGNFTLEINTWRQNVCIESLGDLSGTQTVSRTGTWARGCDSVNRVARYAQYYSFTLTQDTIVTVDLTSPTSGADPYLYLMQGAGTDGEIIAYDNNGGEGRNSRIAHALPPGAYTLQATTYAVRSTGGFTLEIDTSPLNVCLESVGEVSSTRPVNLASTWVRECGSGNLAGRYARYYSFTLGENATVTIRLRSSDASPYVYLIDGTNWHDDVIAARTTQIQYTLAPGEYMVEATTRLPESTGRFRLEIGASPVSTVTSEGALVHGAPAWNGVGVTGGDIRVGVIDGGFSGYDRLRAELPRVAGARCYTFAGVTDDPDYCGGGIHGTGVAEAIIDVAPDVSLYIANPNTPGDLQDAVDWMISEGVEVINQSLSWRFDGPGDGTSPRENSPLRSVDRAVEGGITWVNSAGNGHGSAWLGGYSDGDGDGYIEFHGNDERNTARSNSLFSTFQLRWDDSWTGADTDLDMYVLDSRGRTVARSEDLQTGRAGHVPYESVSIFSFGGEYQVVVKHTSGDAPRWIQLVGWRASLQHHTLGSIGSPAESANPGLLAVGAFAVERRRDDRGVQQPRSHSRRADKAGHRGSGRGPVGNLRQKLPWDESIIAARRWDGCASAPAVSGLWTCGCSTVSEEPGDPTSGERWRNAGSAEQRMGLRVRVPSASANDLEWIPTDIPRSRLGRPVWSIVGDERGRKRDRDWIARRWQRRGAVRGRLRVYQEHGQLGGDRQADGVRWRGVRPLWKLGIHE